MMVIIDFVMHIVQCVSDIISAMLLGVLGLWFIGIIILMTLAVIEWIRECLKSSEPTKRQRIEWLKALPDDEMSEAVFRIVECCKCCVGCDGHNDCSCQQLTLEWMHQAVTLEQFRKDVGLK